MTSSATTSLGIWFRDIRFHFNYWLSSVGSHPWMGETPGFWAVLLAIGYVAFEATYHHALIDLLSSPDTTRSQIDAIEWVGKALAGLGITLVLSRSLRLGFLLSILTLGASIFAVDRSFDYLLDQLSPQARVQGYWLAEHRQSVIDHDAAPPPGSESSEIATRLALAHIALLRFADLATQSGIEAQTRERQERLLRDARKQVRDHWPAYARDMRKLKDAWRKYQRASRKFERSRLRYSYFAQKRFAQKAGGLEPGITDEQTFVRELAKANSEEGLFVYTMRRTVILPAIGEFPDVYGEDVPLHMNKATYLKHFDDIIDQRASRLIPSVATIAENPNARDADAAVFVPPLSLSLSLLSVLTNAAMLVGIALIWLHERRRVPSQRRVLAMYALPLVGVLGFWLVSAQPFQAHSDWRHWQDSAAKTGMLPRIWVGGMTLSPYVYQLGGYLDSTLGLGLPIRWATDIANARQARQQPVSP